MKLLVLNDFQQKKGDEKRNEINLKTYKNIPLGGLLLSKMLKWKKKLVFITIPVSPLT